MITYLRVKVWHYIMAILIHIYVARINFKIGGYIKWPRAIGRNRRGDAFSRRLLQLDRLSLVAAEAADR